MSTAQVPSQLVRTIILGTVVVTSSIIWFLFHDCVTVARCI